MAGAGADIAEGTSGNAEARTVKYVYCTSHDEDVEVIRQAMATVSLTTDLASKKSYTRDVKGRFRCHCGNVWTSNLAWVRIHLKKTTVRRSYHENCKKCDAGALFQPERASLLKAAEHVAIVDTERDMLVDDTWLFGHKGRRDCEHESTLCEACNYNPATPCWRDGPAPKGNSKQAAAALGADAAPRTGDDEPKDPVDWHGLDDAVPEALHSMLSMVADDPDEEERDKQVRSAKTIRDLFKALKPKHWYRLLRARACNKMRTVVFEHTGWKCKGAGSGAKGTMLEPTSDVDSIAVVPHTTSPAKFLQKQPNALKDIHAAIVKSGFDPDAKRKSRSVCCELVERDEEGREAKIEFDILLQATVRSPRDWLAMSEETRDRLTTASTPHQQGLYQRFRKLSKAAKKALAGSKEAGPRGLVTPVPNIVQVLKLWRRQESREKGSLFKSGTSAFAPSGYLLEQLTMFAWLVTPPSDNKRPPADDGALLHRERMYRPRNIGVVIAQVFEYLLNKDFRVWFPYKYGEKLAKRGMAVGKVDPHCYSLDVYDPTRNVAAGLADVKDKGAMAACIKAFRDAAKKYAAQRAEEAAEREELYRAGGAPAYE